jgi:hypothetical protein
LSIVYTKKDIHAIELTNLGDETKNHKIIPFDTVCHIATAVYNNKKEKKGPGRNKNV